MTKKTLGVIGLGSLVSHFFNNLKDLEVNSFKDEVGKVLFLNHGYEKSDFSRKLVEAGISGSLDNLNYNTNDNVRNSFEELFIESHIILDASGGWMPWEKGDSSYSLMRYARALSQGQKIVSLSLEEDKKVYDINITEKRRKKWIRDEFKNNWNFSLNVLNKIREIDDLLSGKGDDKSVFGMRIYEEFPFSLQMIIERGKQMKEVVGKGNPLPTYIVMVNEPCLMSSVISNLCSEMTQYIVSGTGFEEIRLNEILNNNKDYVALKKRVSLEKVNLLLSLRGFHDDYGIVPWLYPSTENEKYNFQQLFSELSDFTKFYNGLKKDVQEYYARVKTEGGDPNESVDRALLSIIVNASRSRGKALSVYPAYSERALCNGFYHPNVFENGDGMFFVGQHRFRNGKVIADAEC